MAKTSVVQSAQHFEWPLSPSGTYKFDRKLTSFIGKEEDCLIFCFLQYVFQGASLYSRLPLCGRYSCVVSRVLAWVTICMKQVSRNSLETRARTCFTVPSRDIVQLCTTPSDFEYNFGWLSL